MTLGPGLGETTQRLGRMWLGLNRSRPGLAWDSNKKCSCDYRGKFGEVLPYSTCWRASFWLLSYSKFSLCLICNRQCSCADSCESCLASASVLFEALRWRTLPGRECRARLGWSHTKLPEKEVRTLQRYKLLFNIYSKCMHSRSCTKHGNCRRDYFLVPSHGRSVLAFWSQSGCFLHWLYTFMMSLVNVRVLTCIKWFTPLKLKPLIRFHGQSPWSSVVWGAMASRRFASDGGEFGMYWETAGLVWFP